MVNALEDVGKHGKEKYSGYIWSLQLILQHYIEVNLYLQVTTNVHEIPDYIFLEGPHPHGGPRKRPL